MTAKYKVGDKLICSGNSSGNGYDSDPTYGGGGWTKNRKLIVSKISDYDNEKGPIYWTEDFDGGIFESFLSLLSWKQRYK